MEGQEGVVKTEPQARDRMEPLPPEPEAPMPPANARSYHGDSSRATEAPVPSQRATPQSRQYHQPQQYPQPQDVWSGAISRLQTQVIYNTSMVDAHRKDVARVENAVGRLQQEMTSVIAVLNEIRVELNARPSRPQSSDAMARRDAGEFEVIAEQLESVSSKANQIDGLKMQVELMKQRMKRLEEQGSPSAVTSYPYETVGPARRESPYYEQGSAVQQRPQPAQIPQHHQQLPSMRRASMASPAESRHPSHHRPGTHELHASQATFVHPTPPSSGPHTVPASPASHFRPSDGLPRPSATTGWRLAEGQQQRPPHPHTMLPPPPAPAYGHHSETQPSGWAAVNSAQPPKRPLDDHQHPSGSASGSPKRPRLAPIMPRSSYGDESYGPSQSPYPPPSNPQSITTVPTASEASSYQAQAQARQRAYSGESAATTQQSMVPSSMLPTQDSSVPSTATGSANSSYRFIPSTANADSQDSWRPESERQHLLFNSTADGRPATGPGSRGGRVRSTRGRGRASAGRGSRGRGRGGLAETGLEGEGEQASQRLGTPEWEKAGWTGSQISPQGYYNPLQPYSPSSRGGRGGLVRRGGGPSPPRFGLAVLDAGAAGLDHAELAPHSPTAGDTFTGSAAGSVVGDGADKKSRTKPTRNAEGILIRKDGRPDMRSVSSANNLRKVHAKKEAERAETEGRGGSGEGGSGSGRGGSGLRSMESVGGGSEVGTPVQEEGEGYAEDHEQDAGQTTQQRYFPDPSAAPSALPTPSNDEPSRSKSASQSHEGAQQQQQQQQQQPHDAITTASEVQATSTATSASSSEGPSQIPARAAPAQGPAAAPLSQSQRVLGEMSEAQAASHEPEDTERSKRASEEAEAAAAAEKALAREEYMREQARLARGGGDE